ncbi:MAG: PilZ domain-containing protein [Acidobacteria bacterium]|nr:PilZ domain-containing protein [Acidobacteriota bacterium]
MEEVQGEDTIMPNPIRYLLGRLRGAVDDRRRASRYNARVSFSISILEVEAVDINTRPPLTLVGRTRNVSESGLGLVVPSLNLGTGHLNDGDSALRLLLDLSGERIEIHVIPVRSYPLDESERDAGFFIGVKITHMSDAAHARYTGFLRSLRSKQ